MEKRKINRTKKEKWKYMKTGNRNGCHDQWKKAKHYYSRTFHSHIINPIVDTFWPPQ
jgi:hypothetical protein